MLPAPLRCSSSDFQDLICVTVRDGSTTTEFHAFKGILTAISGYFDRALSGRWESNNNGDIEIEDDPRAFKMFLNYAYTGCVFDDMPDLSVEYVTFPRDREEFPVSLTHDATSFEAAVGCPAPWSREGSDIRHIPFSCLSVLYAFGDRRESREFSDITQSLMLHKILLENRLPVQVIQHCLEDTGKGVNEPLYKMLVEIAARFVGSEDLSICLDEVPKEFLLNVLRIQREFRSREELSLQEQLRFPVSTRAFPAGVGEEFRATSLHGSGERPPRDSLRVQYHSQYTKIYQVQHEVTLRACTWHVH